MNPAAVSGAAGGTLERAQRLVDEGPEQVRAFEAALNEAQAAAGTPAAGTPAGTASPGPAAEAAAEMPAVDAATRADPLHPRQLQPAGEPGAAEKMLREVERGHQRLAELLGELGSGRTFSPQELLGLQTEMHHIMRQLETTGKLLGEVVSGAKTLLQQQV